MLPVISSLVTQETFSQTLHPSLQTHQLAPAPSPVIMKLFQAIHWVHKTWHWYLKSQIYSKQRNIVPLAAGHVVNFFLGDNKTVRIAATCVYISQCILTCIIQYNALGTACKKVSHAVKGNFPTQQKHEWEQNSNFLSPSTKNSLNKFSGVITGRVKEVVLSIAQVFKEIFKLSMTMLDAINAFYFNPEDKSEHMAEIFVNAYKIIDDLSENHAQLIKTLNDNAPMIDRILKVLNLNITTKELLAAISKNLKQVAEIKPHLDTVQDHVEEMSRKFIWGVNRLLGRDLPIPIASSNAQKSISKIEAQPPRPTYYASNPNPKYHLNDFDSPSMGNRNISIEAF